MHKVLLDGINDNMSEIVHNGKYGSINTVDPTTIVYYVVRFLLESYTLQDDKTVDNKVIDSGELIVKMEYISIMRSNTNWHWKKLGTKESVVISTRTIVHPYLDVSTIKYVADILIILCNKNRHGRL